MTTIPLCCCICPQEPDFSDLSHLLTHVSSKGHLSHHHKAQLRGRGDDDVRQKLDAYDRWYEQHQIEQLLSQRLSAKASRPGHNIERKKPSTKRAKGARTSKSRLKKSTSATYARSPVKAESVIDPQLSHLQPTPQNATDFGFGPNSIDYTSRPDVHVPHMSDFQGWQTPVQSESHQVNYSATNCSLERYAAESVPDNEPDSAAETDYFKAFVRSPTRTACPESAELKPSVPMSQTPQSKARLEQLPMLDAQALFKDEMNHESQVYDSPILKGIKWPGMSLFDSACADAQRLRNQKKDSSTLDRMARNSSVVEQLEHIYWPDGTLKKSRFITGNVDSSPTSQPSPAPKRTRRPRPIKKRSVLSDLGTNGLTLPKRLGRKNKPGRASLSGLQGIENVSDLYPESVLKAPCAVRPIKREAKTERHPLGESPSIRPRRRKIEVFKDPKEHTTSASPDRLSQSLNPYYTDTQSRNTRANASPPPAPDSETSNWYDQLRAYAQSYTTRTKASTPSAHDSATSDWQDQLRYCPKTPDHSDAPERLPHNPRSQAHAEPVHLPIQRVTQRYFSVTGNEETQFFANLPPQMEFGGIAGPKFRGATLNPLNPYLRQSQLRSPHTWLVSARGSSTQNAPLAQVSNVTSTPAMKD